MADKSPNRVSDHRDPNVLAMNNQQGRVSDNRDPSSQKMNLRNLQTYNFDLTDNDASKSSYADATNTGKHPRKEQGFTCEYLDGLTIEDYLYKLHELVDASNIVSAYRSSGKVYIYLLTKELTEKFTEEYKALQIRGEIAEIRPLVVQHKKVIFSNVPPSVPNMKILEILQRNGVRRNSAMIMLHTSASDILFKHIISNKRAVFIHPEDVEKIPAAFKYSHEGETGIIFSSAEGIKCYVCNEVGHIAKFCTKKSTSEINSKKNAEDMEYVMTMTSLPVAANKRNHSQICSESGSSIGESNNVVSEKKVEKESVMPPPTAPAKKKKTNAETAGENLDELLAPARDYLESNESKMNFTILKSFLENNIGGAIDTYKTAARFTDDVDGLCKWLKDEVKPKLTERRIKSRITRIVNKIKKRDDSTLSESEEDSFSQGSQSDL